MRRRICAACNENKKWRETRSDKRVQREQGARSGDSAVWPDGNQKHVTIVAAQTTLASLSAFFHTNKAGYTAKKYKVYSTVCCLLKV